jgi:hypothetical protein
MQFFTHFCDFRRVLAAWQAHNMDNFFYIYAHDKQYGKNEH